VAYRFSLFLSQETLNIFPDGIIPFYLKELEFRYNHRKEDIFPLITKFLCDLVPKHG